MINVKVFLFLVFFSVQAYAKQIVDIYGLSSQESAKIMRQYARKVGAIEARLNQELLKTKPGSEPSEYLTKTLVPKREDLIQDIKKKGKFVFVDLQTIVYPHTRDKFTTIEVVKANQPNRLHYVSPITKKEFKPKDDLINQMIEFSEMTSHIMLAEDFAFSDAPCPVYHCVYSFEHPKLKSYLPIFSTGAIQERKLILDTLNHDPDPARRAAAAFLIGHFQDPKEIISLLSPHVNDPNDGVRNNVIRVMGETIAKAKIDLNVMPFLDLLDSPYVTDRNKSLLVLSAAADFKSSKAMIVQNGRYKLLDLLALKQPNNHDAAYQILKKVSGLNLGEHDMARWKAWADSVV